MENFKVAFVMLTACHSNIVGLEGAHSRPRTRMVEHGDHPSTVHAEDLLSRVPKTHAPTHAQGREKNHSAVADEDTWYFETAEHFYGNVSTNECLC